MKTKRSILNVTALFLALETILILFVDKPLSEWVRSLDTQQHGLIDFFRSITDYGKSKWYLIPSAIGIVVCAILLKLKFVLPLAKARTRIACGQLLFLFVCGAVAGIITDIIKSILGRGRPVELKDEGLYGFHPLTFGAHWSRWNSMPSGHATSVFVFALVVSGFFPRFRTPLLLLAAFMALSRVMVNAHYLSDIVAGAMVAYLCVVAAKSSAAQNGIFHIYKRIFPIDAR